MSPAAARTGLKVLTFGCRLNAQESEVIRIKADEAGLVGKVGSAVIVNTCAVTSEAVRQARQAIRKARREDPGARIVVTGCAAQTEPQSFAGMDEVDLVLGNQEKLSPASYRTLPEFGVNRFEKVRVDDIMTPRKADTTRIASIRGRTRAFVQVQNGCDHRCTFCIIPLGRGNSRSVPVADVVAQVETLVANGHREIVLTGVDTTSWGSDLPGHPRLGQLVAAVLERIPQLERLRLSSIDSIEVDPQLRAIITGEKRFMPHLHLSLQHGDDLILKRMKRRHSRAESIEFCTGIRSLRPEMTFGADLIAGFPTETEEMFANTLDLVEACGLTQLHVFPYSPRPMTPAARMPQVDTPTIRARAARLRAVGESRHRAHLDRLAGSTTNVLMERPGFGRAEDFTPVRLDGSGANALVRARITGNDGRVATAMPVGDAGAQPGTGLSA